MRTKVNIFNAEKISSLEAKLRRTLIDSSQGRGQKNVKLTEITQLEATSHMPLYFIPWN